MRILLCLSGAELLHAEVAQILAECVGDRLLLESNFLVRDRYIIVCESYEIGLYSRTSVEACELIHAECAGDLTSTVGAEIEEDQGIAVLDRCDRCAVFLYYERKYEFIRLAVRIGS